MLYFCKSSAVSLLLISAVQVPSKANETLGVLHDKRTVAEWAAEKGMAERVSFFPER